MFVFKPFNSLSKYKIALNYQHLKIKFFETNKDAERCVKN